MQFGGCYLGNRHLDAIGKIQRTQVETELVMEQIEVHLSDESAGDLGLTAERRKATVAELEPMFHEESVFSTAENGELTATLDGPAVREAARKLIATSAGNKRLYHCMSRRNYRVVKLLNKPSLLSRSALRSNG